MTAEKIPGDEEKRRYVRADELADFFSASGTPGRVGEEVGIIVVEPSEDGLRALRQAQTARGGTSLVGPEWEALIP